MQHWYCERFEGQIDPVETCAQQVQLTETQFANVLLSDSMSGLSSV